MNGVIKNDIFRNLIEKFSNAVENGSTVAIGICCNGVNIGGICDISEADVMGNKLFLAIGDMEYILNLENSWNVAIEGDEKFLLKSDVCEFSFTF